eukprot:5002520-Pyramimonas_sp.AAC.1
MSLPYSVMLLLRAILAAACMPFLHLSRIWVGAALAARAAIGRLAGRPGTAMSRQESHSNSSSTSDAHP